MKTLWLLFMPFLTTLLTPCVWSPLPLPADATPNFSQSGEGEQMLPDPTPIIFWRTEAGALSLFDTDQKLPAHREKERLQPLSSAAKSADQHRKLIHTIPNSPHSCYNNPRIGMPAFSEIARPPARNDHVAITTCRR